MQHNEIIIESVERKPGDEEVLKEKLEISPFSIENSRPPKNFEKICFKQKLEGDLPANEPAEEILIKNEANYSVTKGAQVTQRKSKKYHSRISLLKSKFSIENHRLVEQIESNKIFILYSENKKEIITIFFEHTIMPHLLSIIFFLIFHFIMDYIKLSCFMPEKKCPCPTSDIAKKIVFSFKEIFIQGNFFIFPYYLIFSVRSLKYGKLQRVLYFCLIPSSFALYVIANGEQEYPVVSKNIMLGASFLVHMAFNFLRKFKGRRAEMWNYFKLTFVMSGLSIGFYLFTSFALRSVKEFFFKFYFGDFYFTIIIMIISRFNTFFMNFIIRCFEKLLESEKLNYNPLLYYIKFCLSIQYGFKLASIGQVKTLSLAFGFSLISQIFSILHFHFRFSPFEYAYNAIFRRKKAVGEAFSLKEVFFVQKISSFQRLEMIIIYGSRIIYIYYFKRLIKQHSKETATILNCSFDLISEPNYTNLFAFLIFDCFASGVVILFVKLKKLNHIKYIVDDHNIFVKFLISLALAIHLELYIFHLVSMDPDK